MIKTISLFKNTYGRHLVVVHDDDCDDLYGKGLCFADGTDEYIRLAKAIEVDFIEIDKTAILQKELELIDKAEKTIAAEYQLKLTALQNRRNDLLSISHDGGDNNQE